MSGMLIAHYPGARSQSYSESAEALHVKLGAIKSRLHRARLFLRRRLADYTGRGPRGCSIVGAVDFSGAAMGNLRPDLPLAILWKEGAHASHAADAPS